MADWQISYQPQDNILPGIIPSTFTGSFFGGIAIGTWRQIIRDAKFNYAIEVHEGLDVIWRGFITPDLCSIELINGLRFIKIVASDGFQGLQLRSDLYQYSGVKAFTDQLADMFTRSDMFKLFTGFYVSEHYQPANISGANTQGGLWWTGTIQQGLYFENSEYRTLGEVLNDILTIFGLNLYQDKGVIVLRTCHILTPAWYNYYASNGAFVGRITTGGSSITPVIYSDGLELFKPAIKEIALTYNQAPLTNFIGQDTIYRDRSNWFVAYGISTGANHIDYNATLRALYTIPVNYDEHVDFEWIVQIRYGNYYWNGTVWSTSVSSIIFTKTAHITGDEFPSIGSTDKIIPAQHLDNFPVLGWQPIYITVTGSYVAPTPLEDFVSKSIYLFGYHNASPSSLVYLTDNTAKVNGIAVTLSTQIADKPGELINTPSAGALRQFSTTARTTNIATGPWDGDNNPLAIKTIYDLNRKNYVPYQYYEIELKGVVAYNHTFNWDSVYYKPINLTMSERSTRLTYRENVDGDLESNYFSGRPPFNP